MNKKFILLASLLPVGVFSATPDLPVNSVFRDSVRLNEVVVTGSMTEVSKRQLPLHVEVI